MIILSYEGVPRAHIPAVVWFAGKSIPLVASDDKQHDEYWQSCFDSAPKFSVTQDVYDKLTALLSNAGKTRTPHVVELLYKNQQSELRYLDANSFESLRNALKAASIKGHEILADWP